MELKTCKQCGEIKPLDQYRRYYGGRSGTYTMCLQCERINSREKYLVAKGSALSYEEEEELDKIHQLYEYQRQLGLQPPRRGAKTPPKLRDDLDGMLNKYADMANKLEVPAETIVPVELTHWLTAPLDKEPDYYLDEVYEKLSATYRPCLSVDKATMMPVYDETHKATLNAVLERFMAYEDEYYGD